MLFNSFEFLLLFLPATYIVFAFLAHTERTRALTIGLTLASLAFWSWWEPRQLWFIVLSIAVNWSLSLILTRANGFRRKFILLAGIAFNLGWLCYFKYAAFFASMVVDADTAWLRDVSLNVMLPLGISFFTFQKIAYLVDCYEDPQWRPASLERFSLFVLFFPQLIAGPIVHHREMMPQMDVMARRFRNRAYTTNYLIPGLTLLILGLTKKVGLADTLAPLADDPFAAARTGDLSFLEAWGGAIAYSLQLYFDFSGYSEMALGLGLLFCIRLPLNFDAPYRAESIIDFWRRWHMTLSRFLRDYLYIPLGGNRKGPARRQANLLITMILGGLWHGAAWTFVVWGAIHGAMLVLNHAWRALSPFRLPRWLAIPLTLMAVAAAWVVFRAEGMDAAIRMWKGMLGLGGIVLPSTYAGSIPALPGTSFGEVNHFAGLRQIVLSGLALALIWLAPPAHRVLERRVRVTLLRSRIVPLALGLSLTVCLVLMFVRPNVTFLYFQF